jgi:hypothetical protein
MSARRFATVPVILAVLALLAACGGQQSPDTPPAAPATEEVVPDRDPLALVGLWNLTDADEESGAVLRLAPDRASLWRGCGVLVGSWRADPGGLFVGDMHGLTGCPPSAEMTPAWLRRATAFRVDGENRVLLDAAGATVARLRPGGRPTAGPNVASSEAEPPVVSDTDRAAFAPAAPLPAGLTPAARKDLLGRWEPVSGRTGGAFIELEDGSWRGFDGCNSGGGRWVSGPGGALLATSGLSTLVACEGIDAGGWLAEARRAGLDGGQLVLVDARGEAIGRLKRA